MTTQRTADWAGARPPSGPAGAEGLRERKKAQTRQLLSDTATRMFLDRGFDAVKVTEIAAACHVSEKTVYNYFPTKESLILDRWEATARALRAQLADAGTHPVDAAEHILAGELTALASWLDAQPDLAATAASFRRFGQLMAMTPALRAYQQETTAGLVTLAAGLLADRIGGAADDPEPQIAAAGLVGLWGVYFTALRKYLDGSRTPAGVHDAVTADVAAAARVLRTGLGPFTVAADTAAADTAATDTAAMKDG
ncbi:MAG TPA: TetR family transcriptional regulator [Streptosporangiaceae bacterium]